MFSKNLASSAPALPERTWQQRAIGVAALAALAILAARAPEVEIGPVPLTLQTLAVFLSGLVLGARDGALAQIGYVTLIAAGFQFDARGLGPAVFAGPTAGYLIGFIPCAYVTGWIGERSGGAVWKRALAALVGSICVFVPGTIVLKINLAMTWGEAYQSGFLLFGRENLAKVILAALAAPYVGGAVRALAAGLIALANRQTPR